VSRCRTNANQSPKAQNALDSSGQLAPFSYCSGALLLENGSAIEMTVGVEMVMDRGVNGGEPLQSFDVTEFRHRPFSSAERPV